MQDVADKATDLGNRTQSKSNSNNAAITYIARYQFVTPPMIAGANHYPEFRLTTYAHTLRWWWRFLAFEVYGRDYDEMLHNEAKLFGWHKEGYGVKRVSFRLLEVKNDVNWEENFLTFTKNRNHKMSLDTAQFLAAQAFNETTTNKHRQAAKVSSFCVEINFLDRKYEECDSEKDANLDTAIEILERSIAIIGLLGGLGARSRRGFGSLAIDFFSKNGKEQICGLPASIADYKNLIDANLNPREEVQPSVDNRLSRHTSQNNGFAFKITAPDPSEPSTMKFMNQVSAKFKEYREIKINKKLKHPLPSSYGLPHTYGMKTHTIKTISWVSEEESTQITRSTNSDSRNEWRQSKKKPPEHRRGSPLFFHFHRLANESEPNVLTVSRTANAYLPHKSRLIITKKKNSNNDYFEFKINEVTDTEKLNRRCINLNHEVEDFIEYLKGN